MPRCTCILRKFPRNAQQAVPAASGALSFPRSGPLCCCSDSSQRDTKPALLWLPCCSRSSCSSPAALRGEGARLQQRTRRSVGAPGAPAVAAEARKRRILQPCPSGTGSMWEMGSPHLSGSGCRGDPKSVKVLISQPVQPKKSEMCRVGFSRLLIFPYPEYSFSDLL